MKVLSCALIVIGLASAAHAEEPRPRAGGQVGVVVEISETSAQPRRPRAGTAAVSLPTMATAGDRCGRKYCGAATYEVVVSAGVPAG
jgi:hypothetical protein